MARQVYRKAILDRISSPDQLDKMIVITSPSFWLAVLGGAVIIAVVLVWSIFGSLPMHMETSGVLVSEQKNEEQQVQCYMPISEGKKIVPGMKVIVCPTTVNQQECGNMMGEVVAVDSYVTSYSDIEEALGSESLAQMFSQNGPVVSVTCQLRTDKNTASGFWWSHEKGRKIVLAEGTIVVANIITEERSPISIMLPFIDDGAAATEKSKASAR